VTNSPPRYIVEPGTDGSFLLVDRGADRNQRVAVEQFGDASDARSEAAALSSLEDFTSGLPRRSPDPFWDAAEAAAADYSSALSKERNFNHLLPKVP
jgi:hypothetical protein